jgi:hypothetical protein
VQRALRLGAEQDDTPVKPLLPQRLCRAAAGHIGAHDDHRAHLTAPPGAGSQARSSSIAHSTSVCGRGSRFGTLGAPVLPLRGGRCHATRHGSAAGGGQNSGTCYGAASYSVRYSRRARASRRGPIRQPHQATGDTRLKLPWIGRRRSASAPARAPEPDTSPIDVTIERECFYQAFEGHPGPCPRCGQPLQQSYQSCVIGTRRGSRITDSFLMGSDFGWFCPRCPTVVIDPTKVKRQLEHPLPQWDTGTDFAVLGLANLDAVPPERDDVPLGNEDNSIPLVPVPCTTPSTGSCSTRRPTTPCIWAKEAQIKEAPLITWFIQRAGAGAARRRPPPLHQNRCATGTLLSVRRTTRTHRVRRDHVTQVLSVGRRVLRCGLTRRRDDGVAHCGRVDTGSTIEAHIQHSTQT